VNRRDRLRRRGRTAGHALFALIVTTFTAVWSVQILLQVTTPDHEATDLECRPGVRELLIAVRHARRAAAEETGGERAALQRFRTTLRPAWSSRDQLTDLCQHDPEALRALREVDLLRYAEEHAVRYEAVELARRRRRIRAVEAHLFGASPAPGPAASRPTAAALETNSTPN
jgi:hypothetical protein